MKNLILIFSFGLPALPANAASVPACEQVVAHMMASDAQRQAALHGYTAMRRYTLDNKSRHATMLVRVNGLEDGSKQFSIVEEAGSGAVRKHVFHKILDEEAQASQPQLRDRARLTPQNYSFRLDGMETVGGRAAFVIEVTPKIESKYLIAGRVWVDAQEYAVLRIEGQPAKNPSFWIKSVHFAHTYQKNAAFWFPASNQSTTDARIFGKTEMTIEYFDYSPVTHLTAAPAQRSEGQ